MKPPRVRYGCADMHAWEAVPASAEALLAARCPTCGKEASRFHIIAMVTPEQKREIERMLAAKPPDERSEEASS